MLWLSPSPTAALALILGDALADAAYTMLCFSIDLLSYICLLCVLRGLVPQ